HGDYRLNCFHSLRKPHDPSFRAKRGIPLEYGQQTEGFLASLGMTAFGPVLPATYHEHTGHNTYAVWPPSTTRTWPVTKSEALDARKTAAPFKSSSLPKRPRGILFRKFS